MIEFERVRRDLKIIQSSKVTTSHYEHDVLMLRQKLSKSKQSRVKALILYAKETYDHRRVDPKIERAVLAVCASRRFLSSQDVINILALNSEVRKSIWEILESTKEDYLKTNMSKSKNRLWSPAKVRLFRSLTPEGKRDRVMKRLIKRIDELQDFVRNSRLRNENLSAQIRSARVVKQQIQRSNRDLERDVQNSALKVSQLLQQTSSDREVISYLDKRSKDLDRENVELKETCKQLKETCTHLKGLKVEHERRIAYLELLGGGEDDE